MSDELDHAISQLELGVDLSQQQMLSAINSFLSGTASQHEIRSFLIALANKGETIDELVGAARALRGSMLTINSNRRPIVDTCGTGGDGSKTFNISTAAAIVVAAAGVSVAKHGNRKVTSATGSADVLSELGVNLDADKSTVERCLNEIGLCFCFAPQFHPAMRHVSEARRSIAHPTIFNRLGPLSNPAMAECQVLGVGNAEQQKKLAYALQQLGTRRSIVVRGDDGVDELSISTTSTVYEVNEAEISTHTWHPHDFGLKVADRSQLFADTPESSASCIREVLSGTAGACRDAVVLNSAGALWIAGLSTDFRTCAELACATIDSGAAARKLQQLSTLTRTA